MPDTTATQSKPIPSSTPYYNLGNSFYRTITTQSSEAQTWFNRGLIWIYSFHHDEAVFCLSTALAHDPTCVMAYWGLIYALGPNYNFVWAAFTPDHLQHALQRISQALQDVTPYLEKASPVEQALINAIKVRQPPPNDPRILAGDMSVLKEFGDDLDVAAVYADSMMVFAPWRLWDIPTGKPADGSPAYISKDVLEKAMKDPKADYHPYIIHLYIHLMELSPNPELAVPAADRLRGLIPDAAHLNHMPSHLDVLIGDYRRAVSANADAIVSDDLWNSRNGPMGFYTVYRIHDFQSLIYAAMFNGQYKIALHYTTEMEKSLPHQIILAMNDFLESMLATRLHVFVRFGKWEEIINLPLREDQHVYKVTSAAQYYARGIAFAAIGKVDEALKELDLLVKAVGKIPETSLIYPNKAVDAMAIGVEMLRGEVEYRKKNYDSAFKYLRQATHLYDNLVYGEPWSWMQPVRHAYAALNLEQGNVEEALKTYAEDLGYDQKLPRPMQHPNNVWSLHGYHECLVKLGKEELARVIEPQLRLALAVADVEINSSCYCRNEKGECCGAVKVGVNGDEAKL